MTTIQQLEAARNARTAVARAGTQQKNEALLHMAQELESAAPAILAANVQDIESARGSMSDVMLDRLRLTSERISAF